MKEIPDGPWVEETIRDLGNLIDGKVLWLALLSPKISWDGERSYFNSRPRCATAWLDIYNALTTEIVEAE